MIATQRISLFLRSAMTEPRHFSLSDFLLLAAIVILAAIVRIGYVKLCTNDKYPQGFLFVQDLPPTPAGQPAPNPPVAQESEELKTLIESVRTSSDFKAKAPFADKDEETADTAPGYPMLVGLLARVVEPAGLDRWVKWIQVAVSSLTAGLYFLFARRAFRSTLVGLVAGLLTAFYPLWVINTVAVNDGTLTAFLLALALWLGVRAGQAGGAFSSLLFGLILAGLALTRAYYFPFTIVALAWLLLRSPRLNWGWLCALVAFLGFVIGLAPWTVRNYQVFNQPVPVVDSAPYHLWIGNNPKADGGPVTYEMMKDAETKLNEGAEKKLSALDQPDRYLRLGDIVRESWQNDTPHVINARIHSALYFFLGKRFFDKDEFVVQINETDKQPSEDETVSAWANAVDAWIRNAINVMLAGTMLLMLALAVLGWRFTHGWREESRPATWAMILIPLPYILTHAEALHGPRLPLDGVLLSYAAFALCCLVPFVGGYLLGGSAKAKGESA
jgi:hypothetical protein